MPESTRTCAPRCCSHFTMFWGISLAVVVVVGASFGPEWGLTFGQVSAFLFLADLFLHPFADLPEMYSETQTAIAGWRKILALLDLPVEIVEPSPGVDLPLGALAIRAEDVRYAYEDGPLVLHGVGAEMAARTWRSSARPAREDDVREAAHPARRPRVGAGVDRRRGPARGLGGRAAPNDPDGPAGRLPVRHDRARERPRRRRSDRPRRRGGVRGARPGWVGADALRRARYEGRRARRGALGRGGSSYALARAQIDSPGVLILDEATSAVDPATERRISEALRRSRRGARPSIAHRLSTAEAADEIFVFDAGRIVERGTHPELVARGVYARLYESWLGNVRAER